MPTYKLTLSAASGDLTTTNWKDIPLSETTGPNGTTMCGDQAIDVSAISTATGAVATIAFAWVNGDVSSADGITKYVTATVTPTARRTNYANSAANGYVCTVAFTDSTSKLDVIGIGPVYDSTTSTASQRPDRTLKIGCTDLGGLSSLDVYVTTTRVL